MRFIVLIRSLLFVIAVAGCSKPRSDNPTVVLDQYFRSNFPENEPGGAITILKGDSVIFSRGYGVADINSKERITPQTLFNLGSISKTFVANAILMLQDEEKLSIEDSLWKYFPSFKSESIAKKVKIKHLLTHTSGLPDNRQVDKDSVFYLTAKDAENWYPVTQAEILNFEPGEKFEYSNPAYNGLALIVEQMSGMKWQKFVEEKIMRPAGMLTSTITDGPHPENGVSHGYVRNHGVWREDDYGEEPTFPASGNGGVWSSVEELTQYEKAIKNSVFLKRQTIADSRTIKIFSNWSSTIAPAVGWSWFVGKTPDGLRTVGHTGSQGGFLCNYVTLPEEKIFFVILCNTPRDVDGFTNEILRWLKDNKYFE